MCYIKMFKNLEIIFRIVPFRFSFIINWSHKGYKFSRDNPIKISILYLFIVFVLSWIELFKVIPTMLNCNFESFKTMKNLIINLKILLCIHMYSLHKKHPWMVTPACDKAKITPKQCQRSTSGQLSWKLPLEIENSPTYRI